MYPNRSMNPRLSLLFALFILTVSGVQAQQPAPVAKPMVDEDAPQANLLFEGRRLMNAKKPQEAISNCYDKVIAYFETKYRDKKELIYCCRTSNETVLYMMTAAYTKKQNAVVLNYSWAEAHFLKGYALLDLGKVPEAKASLEKALLFSPNNAQFLSELAYCYQSEKNWPKALELYTSAEEAAKTTSPEEVKSTELARALRGQGYVLVEQGKLDQAERIFEQCLTLNPDDTVAKGELDYTRGLQKK